MKIQLDTTNKTIKVEEKVNLKELLDAVKKLFPNNEWKEYSLETNTVINWSSNPIIIRDYTYPTYPWINTPYYGTTAGNITYTNNAVTTAQLGIYCVETN